MSRRAISAGMKPASGPVLLVVDGRCELGLVHAERPFDAEAACLLV